VTALPAEILHRPLPALVHLYGSPAAVASKDDGQHVTFVSGGATLDAIVDDDATVHAFALAEPAGTRYAIDVGGVTHTLTFGSTTSIAARDELAADAETEGSDFRVFRRAAESAYVLVFDGGTATLKEVIVGDRATLLRLGYLGTPGPTQPQFGFAAPKLRHSNVADGTGPQATVVRIDLDGAGIVHGVSVIIASADDAFDAALSARLAKDRYAPALLGGRPIGSSVFREIRH
jgi:hypothetical protein